MMKLKTVKIEKFRCILNSEEFKVDDITCLVGKNESGKTALLQSIYKLNPDIQTEKFDTVLDYPRNELIQYQGRIEKDPKSHDYVVTTSWEITDEIEKEFTDKFGEDVLQSKTIYVKKGYSNIQQWAFDYSEKNSIKFFIDSSNLHQEEKEALNESSNIKDMIEKLTKIENPSERYNELLTKLNGIFPKKDFKSSISAFLNNFLPKFLYFADYQKMPGTVSIEAFINRKTQNTLTFKDQLFLALLGLAGTTPEKVSKTGKSEELIAQLEAISNNLSKQIFTYWKQNTHLSVEFRYDAASPHDPAPFNTGHVFRTRIKNNLHGSTVNFDFRSTGFIWFFSFLVWFSQVQKNYGDRLIILLDEPGLSLHAKAQGNLLEYIKNELKPKYQVIYTSHSPFMIDAENILSVRTVEDTSTRQKIVGTRVGDDVLSVDRDTIFPLQAALGYDITQTLFVGVHTLLVEGPSDILYLKWFSHELKNRNRTYLDPRWTPSPSGGLDKIPSFISLFSGQKLHIAVLTDFHHGIKEKIRRLRTWELLRSGHVFSAEMFVNQDEADIEDLVTRQFYVELVNQCYSLENSNRLPSVKPSSAVLRVVKEIEEHFYGIDDDTIRFDHYSPATYLIENSGELKTILNSNMEEALNNFEKLFIELNKLLD